MADGSIVIDTKIDGSGLSKQVDGLKSKLDDLGKTLTVAVTAPITALGVFATKAFSDAEKGDARLRASLEMTGQNVEQMFDKYQKLGSAIQEVTDVDDDAVKSLATFGTQLGVTAEAMEDTIKGAIGLSKITGADLQQSMKMAAMAGQGEFAMLERLSPEMRAAKTDAEKYAIAQKLMASGYKLAEAEGRTFSGMMSNIKNALGDLGEQFGQIIAEMLMPFALWLKNLVTGFQQLDAGTKKTIVTIALILAAIGPTILAFTKLISAITAVRSAFLALQSVQIAVAGTTAAIAAIIVGWIALIILAFADWEGAIAGMPDALQLALVEMLNMILDFTKQFLEKIETLMTAIAIITAPVGGLFGKAAFEGLQALVNKSSDKAKAALDRLTKSTERGTKATKDYSMKMKKLRGELADVGDGASDAADDAEEVDYRFQNLFFNLGLAAQKASNAGVGKAISGLFDFMKERAKDTEEYMFLSGLGMNENLASGIVAGVHFAVAATKFLVENIAGAFQKTFAIFSDAFSILSFLADFSPSDLFDSFKGFIDGLTEFFTKDLGSLPIFFDAGMELLENFLDGIIKNLPAIVTTIGNVITHVIDYISENADKIIKQVLTILAAIVEAILKQLPKLVEAIIKSLISLMKNLKKIAPPIIKAFMKALAEVIKLIGTYAQDFTKAFVDLMMEVAKGIIDNIPMILQALANAIPYIIVALTVTATIEIAKASPYIAVALIEALIKSIYMVPAGIISALIDLGEQMIAGIVQGITQAGNIWDKVKKVFTDFVDAVKNFFQIASPSKLFYGFGVDIMQGLINGLNSMMGGLGSVVDKIKDLLGGIGSGIGNFWDDLTDAGGGVIDTITDAIPSIPKPTMPSIPKPSVPNIPKPSVPNIPKPSVPNIPKPSNPFKKKLFAMGTRSAPGGLAMVGERGPELVGLSKGSQVFTATKTGQLLNSIMQGLSSASGLGNMTPSGAYAGQNITLNNKMSGTLSVDGREIGRIAFENIDRFAMGAYGYNR